MEQKKTINNIYANNKEFDQLNTKMAPYEDIKLTSIKGYIISKYNEGYRSGMFSIINPSDGPIEETDSWSYQVVWISTEIEGNVFTLLSRTHMDILYYRYLYIPNDNWVSDNWVVIPSLSYLTYHKIWPIEDTHNIVYQGDTISFRWPEKNGRNNDANNFIRAGYYFTNYETVNAPDVGIMAVYAVASPWISQIWFKLNGEIKYRKFNTFTGSVWSEWDNIVLESILNRRIPGRIVYYEFTFSRETNIDNFYYPETFGKVPNVIALRIADVNLLKDDNVLNINSFQDHIQITRVAKETYGGGTAGVTLYINE